MHRPAQRPPPEADPPLLSGVCVRCAVAVVVAVGAMVGAAAAADAPRTKILTCKDAQGRVLITDPSDPRCYTPPLTPDEMAKEEEARRIAMEKYRECMTQQQFLTCVERTRVEQSLETLDIGNTQVTDLSPLRALPLRSLHLDYVAERDRELLRAITTLQTINGQPAAEFRK